MDNEIQETPENIFKEMSDKDLIEYLCLNNEKIAVKELIKRYQFVKSANEAAQLFNRGE